MTTSIVSPPMQRKAEHLAELLPTLSTGTSKRTGQRFFVVPASKRMTAHWTATDGSGCTCLGYQRRGTCTHSIAAQILHTATRPRFARPSYADLFPECKTSGCTDVADHRDGYCDKCASDREWAERHAQ